MCALRQVLEMLEKGETPPNIRTDIVDEPPDPAAVPSSARLQPRAKPWERAPPPAASSAFPTILPGASGGKLPSPCVFVVAQLNGSGSSCACLLLSVHAVLYPRLVRPYPAMHMWQGFKWILGVPRYSCPCTACCLPLHPLISCCHAMMWHMK